MAGLAAIEILAALSATVASAEALELDIARMPVSATALTVALGQAELRRYSREPGTIIVGDASVAAASIATSDILVLTGLQPGKTNVIVLDDSGAEIDHIVLSVVEPGTMIVVRRGQERQLVRCDPTCAPLDEASLATPASPPIGTPQDAEGPVVSEAMPPT